MSNPIQSMRIVFDVVKAAKDNNNPLSDDAIKQLLLATVSDEKIRNRYDNFSKGYFAEELFRRTYSLLPWIKLITSLGQEQYPEVSKESIQIPDYEVTFEAGSPYNTSKVLIEVKLVDGDKQTFKLLKNTYEVLRNYEESSPFPLVFAIFWRKNMIWTVNAIESFSEKSSSYKISFDQACLNDLSAIFGDYSYMFSKRPYRKSRFLNSENLESEYFHYHEKYGLTVYEGVSIDGKEYNDLCCIETAVLDCAFDYEQVEYRKINELETEIIERLKNSTYIYKLSTLMLGYLLKIYCYDNNDMYYRNNSVVENTFGIVDTVRRKCGGEKFYLLPHDKESTTYSLMKIQFGKVHHIFDAYSNAQREEGYVLLCKHD